MLPMVSTTFRWSLNEKSLKIATRIKFACLKEAITSSAQWKIAKWYKAKGTISQVNAYQGSLHWHTFDLWERTDPNWSKHKHLTWGLKICWYLPKLVYLSLLAQKPFKCPLVQWRLSIQKLKIIVNDDQTHTWKKWTQICFHICMWSQCSRSSLRISMMRQTKSPCRCCRHCLCCWGWKLQFRNISHVGFHK